MEKREKIILVLVLLAMIYGIQDLVFGSSSNKAGYDNSSQKKELTDFSNEIMKQLQNDITLNTAIKYIDKASFAWKGDPFLKISLKEEPVIKESNKKEKSVYKDVLFYSGYLKVANKQIAVINGTEYQVGEAIKEGGYIISKIAPNHINLERDGEEIRTIQIADKLKVN